MGPHRDRDVALSLDQLADVDDAEVAGIDAAADADADADDAATSAAVRRIRRRVSLGVLILLALFAVRAWVVEPVRVSETSMQPTLDDGDALVIDRFSYHFRDPAVGEIVTAHIAATGADVIKRVVAVGGDTIGIDDGRLVRNGVIEDQSYANVDQMGGYFWGPITVPDGHVFLLGDNRLESTDSRNYGPVPVADVDGRYVARWWPL